MPRGPRKLTIRFGAATLTHYGGVYLLHRFLSRLGFKDLVARHLSVFYYAEWVLGRDAFAFKKIQAAAPLSAGRQSRRRPGIKWWR